MIDGTRIAETVLQHFKSLPNKGKPSHSKNEWTVLSAFVLEQNGSLSVIALATGTKCLGRDELSLDGNLVHDSHAEVLARRTLKRYLVDQIRECYSGNPSSIFEKKSGEFTWCTLKSENRFHFFSTHPPCGDATIRPKTDQNDIHRTGAKSALDLLTSGVDYHVLGAVRTKPGRGNPTKSLSCSDKMWKWNYFGLQGKILERWILNDRRIFWSSVTINGKNWSEESVERALITRFSTFERRTVKIFRSHLDFEFDFNEAKKACPDSICWTCVSIDPFEILTEGRKAGAIKKHQKNSRSSVCRLEFAKSVLNLLPSVSSIFQKSVIRYCDLKTLNRDQTVTNYLPEFWPPSDPELKNFVVHSWKLVLLEETEDTFIVERTLYKAGFQVESISVLTPDRCKSILLDEFYEALVFVEPSRCKILAKDLEEEVFSSWKRRRVYCVGNDGVAKAIEKHFGFKVEHIFRELGELQSFLKDNDLRCLCPDSNVRCEGIRSVPIVTRRELKEKLLNTFNKTTIPNVVVVFGVNGVEIVQTFIDSIKKILIVAFASTKVNEALEANGMSNFVIANSSEDIVRCIS